MPLSQTKAAPSLPSVPAQQVQMQARPQAPPQLVRPCFNVTCDHLLDNDGNRIEAHGAGMLLSPTDGRWYWYGESKKTPNLTDHGVTCYSADVLAGPWRYEGQILSQQDVTVPYRSGPFIIERPKVVYNRRTRLFVMWFHLDLGVAQPGKPPSDLLYIYRHAGIAVARAPAGPFRFVHALQPDGIPALDMSLWVDVDGTAYLARSCDNKYMGISGLSADYLNTTGLLSTGPRLEGMALFRHTNGTLYMITSHLTGWKPNPLMLFKADGPNLADPRWVDLGNPTRHAKSFNSQPTYVVPFTTESGFTYFIYMADNWIHAGPKGLRDASYIWLPLRFAGDDVFLDFLPEWNLQDPFARV